MSRPENPDATEIFAPRKMFDRSCMPAAARTIDLSNSDEVFDLARAVACGSDRRVLQASVHEQRAIAGLAVQSSIIASRFLHVLALSDADAPKPELLKALNEAATVARAVTQMAPRGAAEPRRSEAEMAKARELLARALAETGKGQG